MEETEEKKRKRIIKRKVKKIIIIKRKESSIRNLGNNIKCPNVQIIGIPEIEDKKNEYEKS